MVQDLKKEKNNSGSKSPMRGASERTFIRKSSSIFQKIISSEILSICSNFPIKHKNSVMIQKHYYEKYYVKY